MPKENNTGIDWKNPEDVKKYNAERFQRIKNTTYKKWSENYSQIRKERYDKNKKKWRYYIELPLKSGDTFQFPIESKKDAQKYIKKVKVNL